MNLRSKVVLLAVFLVVLGVWAWAFGAFRQMGCTFYPYGAYPLYPLDDSAFGGSSTCDVVAGDSLLGVNINVRSGVAYPAVGVGFNLNSVNSRPVGHFDFSQYDSMEVVFATKYMRSITVRILTDDPVYTKEGFRETLRPVVMSVPASRSFTSERFAINKFRTAVWWISAMGMEEDDGRTYLHRALSLEVVNGDGVMRGIPDEIEVKSVRAWGIDRNFERAMFIVLALMVAVFVVLELKFFGVIGRPAKNGRKDV